MFVFVFMSFALSVHLLSDDDAEDADDFDVDFDDDYECLSDEEFEVSIDDDEYDANDAEADVSGGFCLDDDFDGFGDFDVPEDTLAEKDYTDEAP